MKIKKGNCIECKKERNIYALKMCAFCYQTHKRKEYYEKTKDKPKKKYRINPFSKKKLEQLKTYRKLRDDYMSNNTICEFEGCNNKADDLHHKRPRSVFLNDVSVFMAVCRSCHDKIHSKHIKKYLLGLK